MKVSVDLGTGVAYVQFKPDAVASTVEFNFDLLVDCDELGMVVGLEILDLAADIPTHSLIETFQFHDEDAEELRERPLHLGSFAVRYFQGTDSTLDSGSSTLITS